MGKGDDIHDELSSFFDGQIKTIESLQAENEKLRPYPGLLDAAIDDYNEAKDEIEKLQAALESIASNTCCDKCQEAALVAKRALKGGDDGDH